MLHPFICSVLLLMSTLLVANGATATMPPTYAGFTTATTATQIKALVEATGPGTTAIYLPPGTHTLSNPVVINRTGSVYIHGSGRIHNTRLVANDPTQPLFRIDSAAVVNFANLNLYGTFDANPDPAAYPPGEGPDLEVRAVLMNNAAPVTLEFQNCGIHSGVIDIKGPGTVRLEATIVRTNGLSRTGVLVDHPDAELISLGSGFTGGTMGPADPASLPDYDTITPPDPSDPDGALDFYHVWVLRGRGQIYTASSGHALGRSDYRFDWASALAPHVVAHARSEFAVPPNNTYEATLVYVPPRAIQVDVVLKANTIDALAAVPRGSLIDYNAEGTAWVIANGGPYKSEFIAKGDAKNAKIVALGNEIYSSPGAPLFETATTNLAFAHNLGLAGNTIEFMNPTASLSSYPDLTGPPRVDIVAPIARPRLTAALPGMVDVTAFGATPDNPADDDHAAIQAALDDSCGKQGALVFLPAGTYHISAPLDFNYALPSGAESTCFHGHIGGWIAGEGRTLTKIVNTSGGGVFRSDSIKRLIFQGLTFETAPYHPAMTATESVVALEYVQSPVGSPTQRTDTSAIYFYDVGFDGGLSGVSAGIASEASNSELIFAHCDFRNAHIGFRNGSFNALNNITYATHFEDNDYAAGVIPGSTQNTGGNWGMYSTTIRNSGIRDFHFEASGRTHYLLNLDTDSDVVADQAHFLGNFVTYDASSIAPQAAGNPVFSIQRAGGLTFLDTSVTAPSNIRLEGLLLGGNPTHAYSLSLWSDIPDHAASVAVEATGHVDDTTTFSDGVAYFDDNCPTIANAGQEDADADGRGDVCDFLPNDPTETTDFDGDGLGDNADADDDGDGVFDLVEDAAPGGGDGNADGVLDSQQPHVTSLPGLGGNEAVTLEVSGGCSQVGSASLVTEAAMATPDAAYAYPLGLLAFSLPCAMADVKIYFHSLTTAGGPYRKFGPTTPGDLNTNAWYDLASAVFGSEIVGTQSASTMSFSLADGELGDATGLDGVIVDPGGPAFANDGDADGVPYESDNCVTVANPLQIDSNQDGYGNACDTDLDNNRVTHTSDQMIFMASWALSLGDPGYNPDADFTADDTVGGSDWGIILPTLLTLLADAGERNQDNDGWTDSRDNCPLVANSDQANADGDLAGDACDAFPNDPEETADFDGDGTGDVADLDDDGDGAADAVELVGPSGGDANVDGVADVLQSNVASMLDIGGTNYVTAVISGECTSTNATTITTESGVAPEDAGYDYPLGIVGFTLPCDRAGVTLYFHNQAPSVRYRKFGATTPGDALTNTWYDLPNTFFATQMLGGNLVTRVSFLLHDGALGDSTPVDGVIVDPGGPAVPAGSPVPTISPVGAGLLIVAIVLSTRMGLRRRGKG